MVDETRPSDERVLRDRLASCGLLLDERAPPVAPAALGAEQGWAFSTKESDVEAAIFTFDGVSQPKAVQRVQAALNVVPRDTSGEPYEAVGASGLMVFAVRSTGPTAGTPKARYRAMAVLSALAGEE